MMFKTTRPWGTLIFSLFLYHGTFSQTGTTYFSLTDALKNPDNVYQLDLSYQNLKEVPLSLSKLTKLKRLNLSHNQITRIPKGLLDSLSDLRRLHLNDNRITELPAAIYSLENLKKLYLDHNQLKSVSTEISRLANLKRLSINKNKLTEIPIEILQLPTLEWLDVDDNVFLSKEIESLSAYLIENWKCISHVPDSIEGLPLSYYLSHPSIDPFSKLFVQDRYALRFNLAHCPFIDSLFTENEETAPFYTYLYFDLLKENFDSNTYLDAHLCSFTDQFMRKQPCRYLKGLMENEYGYSCVDDYGRIDSKDHQALVQRLTMECPEILEDRARLYFNYLNHHLPADEVKGLLTTRIIWGEWDKESPEAQKYNLDYVMILSDSADKVIQTNEWANMEDIESFYRLLPSSYILRVFCKEHYVKRKEEEIIKMRELGQSLYGYNSIATDKWFGAIKNESLIRIDTSINSIDERIEIQIPISHFVGKIEDSVLRAQEELGLTIVQYAIPEIDYEHHDRKSMGECDALDAPNDSTTLALFLKEIYDPAKKSGKVVPENMKFLEEIKAYLIRRAHIARDSIYALPFPLMAVYEVGKSDTEKQSVRILDESDYSNWQEDEMQPGYTPYYYHPLPDSLFYNHFMGEMVNVHYDNGQIRSYRLNRHELISDVCNAHNSYELYELDTAKVKERPVFASFGKLTLEMNKDTLIDKHMELVEKCRHSYCDSSIPQVSFARLKGVPKLIFTTDQDDDWMNRYPGRSLFMKLSSDQIIELWNYEVEHVGCSCI